MLSQTRQESVGAATKMLQALEESSFVVRSVPFGKRANEAVYRLVDEYSLFDLTWVSKVPGSVFISKPTNYWLQKRNSHAGLSWAGYAFESICQKHAAQIKQGLSISGMHTTVAGWSYRLRKKVERGTQIDLLIDRSDNCITLC